MAVTINSNGTITGIAAGGLPDGVVDADTLADNAVTTAKINADAVTAAKVADNAVTTAKINADAVTAAKVADDVINSEHLVDGGVDNAHLATGIASSKLSGALPAISGAALTGISGGKVVQYAKINNSSAVTTTSTTMVDIPGVTVTLTGVTIGNILEISGIVPIRKNTGYYTHPGVGIKIDNSLIDNSTWGTGVHMTSSDVWITKFPILTFYTATATSHTIKMCGNNNYNTTITYGGEINQSTAYDYARVWMMVKELDV